MDNKPNDTSGFNNTLVDGPRPPTFLPESDEAMIERLLCRAVDWWEAEHGGKVLGWGRSHVSGAEIITFEGS